MKKKSSSLGMLFWLAVVLLVVAVFLYNRRNIENVLASTGFLEQLRNRFGAPRETIELVYSAPQTQPDAPIAVLERPLIQPEPAQPTEPSVAEPSEPNVAEPSKPNVAEPSEPPADEPPASVDSKPDPQATLTSGVYFIRVDNNGTILPVAVDRILRNSSPMRHTIEALLQGPTIEEMDAGLLNLIPKDTELLSATIREGIVYLNFNEAFRFNPLGSEGMVAQLQQIIYSATSFDTIHGVQILIEGNKEDYLGGENVYIGVPLDRTSFG